MRTCPRSQGQLLPDRSSPQLHMWSPLELPLMEREYDSCTVIAQTYEVEGESVEKWYL